MSIISAPENFLKRQGLKNPKPVIYGILAVATGIIIFLIVKSVKSRSVKKSAGDNEGQLYDAGAEQTTISKGDAIVIARNLLNAMNRIGTDEQAIIDNLSRCRVKGDMELVIQTFGSKPYSGIGLASTFLNKDVSSVMKDLSGWLKAELTGTDLSCVKAIYNNLGVSF